MKLVGRDIVTWDEGDNYTGVEEWSFYLCPTCKAPTLLCWYWQQKDGEITSEVGRGIAYPSNIFDRKSVPENIRRAFMAAAATKSIDTAVSLIAWRRVLELTCKDLGAQGRTLNEKISDLSAKKSSSSFAYRCIKSNSFTRKRWCSLCRFQSKQGKYLKHRSSRKIYYRVRLHSARENQ